MRIADLDTPALIVNTNVMARNISRMASYARENSLRLRPHTKTHKVPAIAEMQMQAGACGITVAKIGEAEVMAAAGLQDILIAYPLWGAAKLDRLASIARRAALRWRSIPFLLLEASLCMLHRMATVCVSWPRPIQGSTAVACP